MTTNRCRNRAPGGGFITYDNSKTDMSNFEYAISESSLLIPYELTELQNFYAAGGRFPSFYELTGVRPWCVYCTNIYAPVG